MSAVMSLTDSSEKEGLDVQKTNDYGTGIGGTTTTVEETEKVTENGGHLIEEGDAHPAWMAKYCSWMLKYPWIVRHFVTKKSKKGELERVVIKERSTMHSI